MKLGHAAIKTNDLNASVNFYTKILGLSVKEKRYIEIRYLATDNT